MATLSGDDEASAAEDSAGERHLKFKCAYKKNLSTSTCDTDSASQSDRSNSNVNPRSTEVDVEEKDEDVYSELRHIRQELQIQRQMNADMQDTMKDILGECRKLSALYSDLKFEMLSLKGEGKVTSGKYVKMALMRNRRKTSPSSLMSFSISGSNTEKANDDL